MMDQVCKNCKEFVLIFGSEETCPNCKEIKKRNNMINKKIEKLQAGETITSKEPGNSMTPIIKHRQPVRLAPASWQDCEVGDVVYCRVKGNIYTHLVTAKDPNKGLQISNNHGRINGWTKIVYGKMIEAL